MVALFLSTRHVVHNLTGRRSVLADSAVVTAKGPSGKPAATIILINSDLGWNLIIQKMWYKIRNLNIDIKSG